MFQSNEIQRKSLGLKDIFPLPTVTSVLLAFCRKSRFVSFCIYQSWEKTFQTQKGFCLQISEAAGGEKTRQLCAVYAVVTEVQRNGKGEGVGSEDRDLHRQVLEKAARFTAETFQLNPKR